MQLQQREVTLLSSIAEHFSAILSIIIILSHGFVDADSLHR